MSFISLPTGTLHKKPEKGKLKNFPAGCVGKFYRNLADNVDTFLGSEFYERVANDANIPSEDVLKYIWQLVILQRECKQILNTM